MCIERTNELQCLLLFNLFASRHQKLLVEFDCNFRTLVKIGMHGCRRFPDNCPLFYGKIAYFLPFFNDGKTFLVGHQQCTNPLTFQDGSFQLKIIRYDRSDAVLMSSSVPRVEVCVQVDDKWANCLLFKLEQSTAISTSFLRRTRWSVMKLHPHLIRTCTQSVNISAFVFHSHQGEVLTRCLPIVVQVSRAQLVLYTWSWEHNVWC